MSDQEAELSGVLRNDAAKALMRLLCLSRLSRPDLSFVVCRLASNVSRWSKWDDRPLHRVVSYLNTISYRCCGSVSDGHMPVLHAYSDADFASCPWSAKSTSGKMLGIKTGESFFQFSGRAESKAAWQDRHQGQKLSPSERLCMEKHYTSRKLWNTSLSSASPQCLNRTTKQS